MNDQDRLATRLLVCAAITLLLVLGGPAAAQEDADAPLDELIEEGLEEGTVEVVEEPPAGPALVESPEEAPSVRGQIEPSPLVDRLLEDPLTDEAERRRLQIMHGRWEDLPDDLTVEERALLALLRWELDHPVFDDDAAPALLRAEAALRRGEPAEVHALLPEADNARAALLRAQAYEQLGRLAEAVAELQPWRDRLRTEPMQDAAELTAAARALALLAQLEGRPAQDYQLAVNLLGQAHQQLDPLYWPAHITEAELLIEKDNASEAIEALVEALSLNLRASEAWYRLGRLSARGFAFERADDAIDELRQINEHHLLADILEAHTRLQQRDVSAARSVIEAALERYPGQRELHALAAATEALAYDTAATEAALARFDELAPGHPLGPYVVGVYLSLARQYGDAEAMLREAIERQPNWPAPHIELGLLLMQAGDNEAARAALARAVRIDPYNRRANNQLNLVEELLGYAVIETDHFLIRYKPGIDEVLARDMPPVLEDIYRDITTAFGHKPPNKTQIDIMPDEEWFGVRITGMPEIWTIGASTGDVIAITPPREGPKQRGTFDWATVIRHEYVHTVTLSQTRNRLPHWFTEACAVSQELGGRDYNTCQLLAWALHHDKLFDLANINWGFIRPKTPRDRPLAYAQAHWMLEFITLRFGHDAVLALLDRYGRGMSDTAALAEVTGMDAEAFMTAFKAWAAEQVRQWGLSPMPAIPELEAVRRGEAALPDRATLESLIAEHGEHPELLRLLALRTLEERDTEAARQAVLRYAAARPVDPWSHRVLATLAIKTGRTQEAIASLQQLDRQEVQHGDWAHQLAQLHRASGNLDAAARAIERALRREPYNGTYRELAATIALQRGEMEDALHHLRSMTILEPDRAIHQVRLAALHARLGQTIEAKAAAERAREIDPDAPVGRFLD